MKERWALFILLILTGVFAVLGRQTALSLQHLLLFGLDSENSSSLQALEAENAALKSETMTLLDLKNELDRAPRAYIKAFVYSRYPFNFKDELVISAGEDSNVSPGDAVVVPGTDPKNAVLIGLVQKVFPHSAVVETIFDARFKLAARIGSTGIDALTEGGTEPKLTLIPKTTTPKDGDAVYSVAAGIPYGLAIGEVIDVKLSANQLFQESKIKLPYDINTVHAVLVIKNVQ